MLIYAIIILAVIARFIPHIPNAAPVTALAIFAAVYLPKKQAIVVPLLARFVSDLFLGFFSWPLMVAVYASHLAGLLLGFWVKGSVGSRWAKILGASVFSAVLFFLVTNFAFLYAGYPHTWAGIALAYGNGLPFLRGTLLGDVGYTMLLFGSYEFAHFMARKRHGLQTSPV